MVLSRTLVIEFLSHPKIRKGSVVTVGNSRSCLGFSCTVLTRIINVLDLLHVLFCVFALFCLFTFSLVQLRQHFLVVFLICSIFALRRFVD